MPFKTIPIATNCCRCIPDLKTAVAIIAALAIVTSPVLSWVMIKHTYVIRVSCVLKGHTSKPDVVEINFQNVLSFGFGHNAGINPSCFSQTTTTTTAAPANSPVNPSRSNQDGDTSFLIPLTGTNAPSHPMLSVIKYMGFIVLLLDVCCIISAALLLHALYLVIDEKLVAFLKAFMFCCLAVIITSFIYGIIFVTACYYVGQALPVFEFFFLFFDTGLWLYFIIVVNSYRLQIRGE